jgi:hypothetical protein
VQVTEVRKRVMPLDGTFDFWILLFSMTLSLFSAAIGIKTLVERDALLKWDNGNDSLRWIGIVFAIADATPGILFLGCAFSLMHCIMLLCIMLFCSSVSNLVVLVICQQA